MAKLLINSVFPRRLRLRIRSNTTSGNHATRLASNVVCLCVDVVAFCLAIDLESNEILNQMQNTFLGLSDCYRNKGRFFDRRQHLDDQIVLP